jgi:hypothetical protein
LDKKIRGGKIVEEFIGQLNTSSLVDIVIRVGLAILVLILGWLIVRFFVRRSRKILASTPVDNPPAARMGADEARSSIEEDSGSSPYKKIQVITNPAAGQDEPVLSILKMSSGAIK